MVCCGYTHISSSWYLSCNNHHVCVCMCMHLNVDVCIYVYMHAWVCMCKPVSTCDTDWSISACVYVCVCVSMYKPVYKSDTVQYLHYSVCVCVCTCVNLCLHVTVINICMTGKQFADWPNTAADGSKIEDEVMVEVLALLHVKAYHFHNTQQGCAHW